MRDMISTKLHALENDRGLLSFRTDDDIPVYLMAKSHLVYENVMPLVMDMKLADDDRRINTAALRFLAKAVCHNIVTRNRYNQSEIVLYVPSRPVLIDGLWVNRYSDLLAEEYRDKSLTIEQTSKNWLWPFPRKNERVLFDGMMNAVSSITAKIFRSKDREVIIEFLQYYNQRLNGLFGKCFSENEIERLAGTIDRIIQRARYQANWLDKTLPDSTKLLIMVGASYPNSYPITKRMKDRGIKVADLQHGFITKTNAVYSYAEEILHSAEAKAGAADYFLTYGDWWNDQILNPSTKVSIGNPYREYSVARVKINPSDRILIIGCGSNTEKCIQLAETIEREIDGYQVVFRPHPGEIEMAKSIISEKGYQVKLDTIKEVYESLAITKVVISEMSTVLFEAIGICKKIIILDTDYSRLYLPDNPFTKCDSKESVIRTLKETNECANETSYEIEKVWKENWKYNYRTFVSEIIS